MEAYETPLIDLLASVPVRGVATVDLDKFCTTNIPYGTLCHRALAEILTLQDALASARADTSEYKRGWDAGVESMRRVTAMAEDVLKLHRPDAPTSPTAET